MKDEGTDKGGGGGGDIHATNMGIDQRDEPANLNK